jgi:hypothetical protein
MASITTVNYPNPVTVNGYSCKNCTEVDEAKKHIDPAHPKDGPYGVNAKNQPPSPSDPATEIKPKGDAPAVTFGGALAGITQSANAGAQASATVSSAIQPGQRLNLVA